MLLKLLVKILSAVSGKERVHIERFYYDFFSRERKDLSSKYGDLFQQELCSEVEGIRAIPSLGYSNPRIFS